MISSTYYIYSQLSLDFNLLAREIIVLKKQKTS